MGFPSMVLGSMDLTDWSGIQFNTAVIAEGMSRGAPVPIEVAVRSWLQDGSIVVTQGYDNREVTLRVRLSGPDLLDLAEAEAALFAELGKPNLLTWTPADGFGPPSVFVVVTSSMEHAPAPGEDMVESRGFYPWRSYNLRLLCEAFVRSVDEVAAEALPLGTTTTVLDACSSATGWSGFINGASASVANGGGANTVSTASVGSKTLALQKTLSADTSTLKVLRVEWAASPLWASPLKAVADGVSLPSIVDQGTGSSTIASYFAVQADSIGVLRLGWVSRDTNSLSIHDVAITDGPPPVGSSMQQMVSVDVKGSARTPATLEVASEAGSLGDVLLYVWADSGDAAGYLPALSTFGPDGSSDATAVSGFKYDMDDVTARVYNIPRQMLPPGEFLLMARLASTSGITVGRVEISTTVDNLAGAAVRTLTSPTLSLTTAWSIQVLGRCVLPTLDLPATSARDISLALTVDIDSGANFCLDETWLFHRRLGSLIWVAADLSHRLWVLPPTVETPRPRVLVGYEADMSDALYPENMFSWDLPQFVPSRANILAVTTGGEAAVTLHHTPAWHTHAAL